MNLSDIYHLEEQSKIQDNKCKTCLCFSCLIQTNEKCKDRCFKHCKKNRHPWTKCRYYEPIC